MRFRWHLIISLAMTGLVSCGLWLACAQAEDAGGAGLQGYYFAGKEFEELKLVRVDPAVNFDWNAQAPAPEMPREFLSVRWMGKVQAKFTESYTFYVNCDDGQRLWVNGQQLVDDWTEHGATERSGTIDLQAGQKYEIRMEFFQGGGGASAQLSWSSPSQPKEVIPQQYLYPPLLEGGKMVWDDNAVIANSAIWLMDADGQVKKLTDFSGAEPELSRDGRRIIFISTRDAAPADPKTVPNTDLYLMNSDGTKKWLIARTPAAEITPTFAPDGQKIAYAANGEGNWEIYTSNFDGSFTKRLTKNPGADIAPSFSPSGKQVVFQSNRDGHWEVYTVNRDGTEETRVTQHGGFAPVYAPGGQKIAYLNTVDGKTDLYLINLDGSGEPARVPLPAGEVNCPLYSPYGCELAVVTKDGVSIMRPDGGGANLLPGVKGCVNISWSF